MKTYRSISLSILFILLFAACRSVPPTAGPPAPPPEPPAITLNPIAGGPETALTITGAYFPPNTLIDIYLSRPITDTEQSPLTSLQSADDGAFTANVVVPATWPDGAPITGSRLLITAASVDFSIKATAEFGLQVSAGLQPYFNAEGDFSIALPPGWSAGEPENTVVGKQYAIGPQPIDPAAAPGALIVADAAQVSIEHILDRLCGGCDPQPELADVAWFEAQVAAINGQEWYFVENGATRIAFSIRDLETGATLDAVVQTFRPGSADLSDLGVELIPAAVAARETLAQQLGVNPYTIVIQSAEPMEWPDACLGAPGEGETCAQAITPGYVGMLQTRTLQFEFHTDDSGSTVRLIPGAALSARQILMQRLGLTVDAVKIVGVERVDWPDACLGVPVQGAACAEVITSGYAIALETEGQRYEFHTDESGSDVRLAAAPAPDIKEPAIVWTQDIGGVCQTAIIGGRDVAFGPCGGTLMAGRLIAEVDRPEELAAFVETYASFEADTRAGKVAFTGNGSTIAAPAEQRMIAEWARLAQLEAAYGRSGASYGLALAWYREGGIAGFCDDMVVYVTGLITVASCKGDQSIDVGRGQLTADQLDRLYAWIDRFIGFEISQTDPATADALTIRVIFTGAGAATPTDADQQAIQAFAAEVFAGFGK